MFLHFLFKITNKFTKNLLKTCSKLDTNIRLVRRILTTLIKTSGKMAKMCTARRLVINLHQVLQVCVGWSLFFELIVSPTLLQVVNSLLQTCSKQTCYKQCEHNSSIACEHTCYNHWYTFIWIAWLHYFWLEAFLYPFKATKAGEYESNLRALWESLWESKYW